MIIKPLGKRVLVTLVNEEKKEGNILLPETIYSANELSKGIVFAVSKELKNKIQTGVSIYFNKNNSKTVKGDGEEFYLVEEDSIWAINE